MSDPKDDLEELRERVSESVIEFVQEPEVSVTMAKEILADHYELSVEEIEDRLEEKENT